MDFARKFIFVASMLCVLISLKNQKPATNRIQDEDALSTPRRWKLLDQQQGFGYRKWLRYDYYNESCPSAEKIIRSKVQELYTAWPYVAPSLLRLVFHDCFVEGCDASILLDPDDGIESEKDSPPNESLKGFDLIDIIKAAVEEACPGVVSCADILALSGRESAVLAGSPFYPLYTGRRDSTIAYPEIATFELPSHHDDLSTTIELFASRGFDERETVTLFGVHSTGAVNCESFNRFYNFSGSERPDLSIDVEFAEALRSKCSISHPSPEPEPTDDTLTTLFPNPGRSIADGFSTLYYRNLLQGKGLVFADQQLIAGEETKIWVRAYASNEALYQRDFGLTMMKLSSREVLTEPSGQVRLNCRRVN